MWFSSVPSPDLSQVAYRHTTCGAVGRNGPDFQTCSDYYRNSLSAVARDGTLFAFDVGTFVGAQGFRVPRSGWYNITVAGAAGGRGICSPAHGRGAIQKLHVRLEAGSNVLVLVGQRGWDYCDTNPQFSLCTRPPITANDSAQCSHGWLDWAKNQNLGANVNFLGGGGGGGASMVWLQNSSTGQFQDLPLAISGGGGGSAALFDSSIAQALSNLTLWANVTSALNLTGIDFYLYQINAKLTQSDVGVTRSAGKTGRMYWFSNIGTLAASGGGGGWEKSGDDITDSLAVTGKTLSSKWEFATGGAPCVVTNVAPGGFGGGGGGCGSGGGGGGWTGGWVLGANGNVFPGAGGYSLTMQPTHDENVSHQDTVPLNDGDGYVNFIPSDCGCAGDCDVDASSNQFGCRCPSSALLGPDLTDCYYGEAPPSPTKRAYRGW